MNNLIIKKYNENTDIKKCVSTSLFLPLEASYTPKMNVYLLGLIKYVECFEKFMKYSASNKDEYWKLRIYYDSMFDYKYDKFYPNLITNSTYKLKLTNDNNIKKTKKNIKVNLKLPDNNYNYIFNAIKYYLNYIKKNFNKYKYIELYSYEYKDKKIMLPGHEETFGSFVRFEAFFDKSLTHVFSSNIRNFTSLHVFNYINDFVKSDKNIMTHNLNYYLRPTKYKYKKNGKKIIKETVNDEHFKITYDLIHEINNITPKTKIYNKLKIYRYLAGIFALNTSKYDINLLKQKYNLILNKLVDKINYVYGVDEYLLVILFYYNGMINDTNKNFIIKHKNIHYINDNSTFYYYYYPYAEISKSLYYINCLLTNEKFNNAIPIIKINYNAIKLNISKFKKKYNLILKNIKLTKITELEQIFNKENNERFQLYLIVIILHYFKDNNADNNPDNNKFINKLTNMFADLIDTKLNRVFGSISIKLLKLCDFSLLKFGREAEHIFSIENSLFEYKPLIIFSDKDIDDKTIIKHDKGFTQDMNVFEKNKLYTKTNYIYNLYNYTNKTIRQTINYCRKYYNNNDNILLLNNSQKLNDFINKD